MPIPSTGAETPGRCAAFGQWTSSPTGYAIWKRPSWIVTIIQGGQSSLAARCITFLIEECPRNKNIGVGCMKDDEYLED